MESFTSEKNYSIDVEVLEERPLRATFLTNPFVVVVPEQRKQWWERFTAENRWIKGRSYFIAKRIMDLALVILSLPVVIPVMALCALFIKLESPGGPVLFKQQRTGKGGKRFAMYKFRTMVPNAEELKHQLAHLNVLQWPDFKIPDDPRITRIGRFLRKSSLDELPQIINIVSGEMSFVGPRPTSFSPETYDLWHTERLDVTPGLTGLWQVHGRAEMEFDDRVRLDVAYIERRGLALDFVILLRTVFAVLERKGAL
jgi:lipopolysaccharide/colanic/teichoic acid biosynthesis glycosyltransferase